MNEDAWYLSGHEYHHGQLQLCPDALRFNRRKNNRAGVFAAFGLLGLLLASKYETYLIVSRAEIRGVQPSAINPNELAVYTSRGMLVFNVPHRDAWLAALVDVARDNDRQPRLTAAISAA